MFTSWVARIASAVRPLTMPRRRKSAANRGALFAQIDRFEQRQLLVGAFAQLTNANPNGDSGTMLLLTDGSLMVQTAGVTKTWAKLTPDNTGNYLNGTWSPIASMALERLWYNSTVLPNGKVLVMGGQFSGPMAERNDTNKGEIYDPQTNTWSPMAPFPFPTQGSGVSVLLPSGKWLVGNNSGVETFLYDPALNTWSATGSKLSNDKHDQTSWILLKDGSVLAYSPASPDTGAGRAQRYLPSTGLWVATSSVPVGLTTDALGREVGTGTVLPNGKVLLIGANKNMVFYDPATNLWSTSTATSDFPVFLDPLPQIAIQDQPGAMLPDGKYLFLAGSTGFAEPSYLFEYDYLTDDVTQVGGIPGMATALAYKGRMLVLPNGQVLLNIGEGIHIASPSGPQLSSLAPSVVRIDQAATTPLSYNLIGTQLNGFSQGATYGHGASMDTNYPIVRLRDPATGLVKYTKSTNWTPGLSSSALVETTVQFALPTGFVDSGEYQLSVITNGIASPEVTFRPNDMVKDIFLNTTSSDPKYLTNVNGTVFFSANDGQKGAELWKSDGTRAGTVIVKDIRAGLTGSNPKNLMNVNGVLYFTADNGINGVELWRSDGSVNGTVLVKDIFVGRGAAIPSNLTNVNGTIYFSATTSANGVELWKSDGTANGTVLVKDIRAGVVGSSPLNLTNVNGTLFFTATDGVSGVELWKSTGTAAGTVRVKDIWVGSSTSAPANLTAFNGSLYFSASSGVTGAELWKSDGTTAGTVLLKDIDTRASIGSNPKFMTAYNGNLYFQASTLATGAELWRTDGTTGGTFLVKDVNLGKVGSSPSNFHVFNGSLYFQYADQLRGAELAKSNGTAAGTNVFKNLNTPVLTSSHPSEFVNIGSTMYFKAADATTGYELWKSDGTVAGTSMVKDIYFRTGDSDPSGLLNVNGKLFFTANNGFLGSELFMINTNLSLPSPPAFASGVLSTADDGSGLLDTTSRRKARLAARRLG